MTDTRAALQQHFGFSEFRPGQQQAIEHLLAGHSTAAVFPTGGGKSLCYQLPALLMPGLTLVVSPLIALMKDQIDALHQRGIRAARLDSSLSLEEYRDVMDGVRSGSMRLLYVAPERFNNERFRQAIDGIPISLFAVDEAHCISEWGHNFRPDYLKLAGYAQQYNAERVLALTATATPRVLDDICTGFDIAPAHAVRTEFHRPNLTLRSTVVTASQRDDALLDVLRDDPAGPTIVYVTLQKTAEDVARNLGNAGLQARAYHAGMKDDERSGVQEWFMASDSAVVVATIAFGMGIDKDNIRRVVHYNLPKSLENYAQEIGRAGRDGGGSVCHTLVCADDLTVLENFVYGDTPDDASVRALVDSVFAQDTEFDISQYELSSKTDIRQLVLRTLLTRLELDGYLQGGTPFYSEVKFKPLVDPQDIFGRFEGERRQFLEKVFGFAKEGRVWLQLDPAQAANALQTDRERIIKALDYLGDQGLLEVQAGGVRNRYRQLRAPDDAQGLSDELTAYNEKREAAEIARLQQVLDLFARDGCRAQALAAHFGEQLADTCGVCSGCTDGGATIPERQARSVPDGLDERIQPVTDDAGEALSTPRAVARFLCGLTSPKMTRARLTRNSLFGELGDVPFPAVLAWAQERRT